MAKLYSNILEEQNFQLRLRQHNDDDEVVNVQANEYDYKAIMYLIICAHYKAA